MNSQVFSSQIFFSVQNTAVLDPLIYHNSKQVSVRKNDLVFKVLLVNADAFQVLNGKTKKNKKLILNPSSQVEKFQLYNDSCCWDQKIIGSNSFCTFVVTCYVTYTKIELK